jgi:hypothetical protein
MRGIPKNDAQLLNHPMTMNFMKNRFMKKNLLLVLALMACQILIAQEGVYQTFKDRWVINSQSVETLPQRKLDVRIAHRFGDAGGRAGGWPTFYGLENASDVSIGAEYGILNNLTVGFNRSKGAGQLRQLLNASMKYKVFQQMDGGKPISLAVAGMVSLSTAQKSDDPSSLTFFETFSHRMVHNIVAIAARKFSDKFSLQFSSGLTHRNVVPAGEGNNTFYVGVATRIQVTRTLGIIGDVAYPFVKRPDNSRVEHHTPLGIGFEFDTGGHVFQLNLTNSTGLMPTDYIPYTVSSWREGEFRIGFTISRLFNL